MAFGHLALTVLQQSLLCPLPLVLQPVHWAHDHALQLYPLPHTVVIADSSPQASFQHESCLVFNPVGGAPSRRRWLGSRGGGGCLRRASCSLSISLLPFQVS